MPSPRGDAAQRRSRSAQPDQSLRGLRGRIPPPRPRRSREPCGAVARPRFTVLDWLHVGGTGVRTAGRYDRALERLANAQRLSGNNSKTISLRGYILARIGLTHEARAALEDLAITAATTYVPPYAAALIHAGLGDRKATFEWLERAYAVRDIHLVLLRIDRSGILIVAILV